MSGRNRQAGRARTVGTLDIGSAKIMCLIATVTGPTVTGPTVTGTGGTAGQAVRVLGIGVHRSQGITSGVVTDLNAAAAAVRAAVAQAERASGVTLAEVTVAITCGRLRSLSFAAHADAGPRGVTGADIARLFKGAQAYAERDGRALVHMNRKLFRLDGYPAGDDPRGMAARRVSADIHAVTADDSALRNIIHLVETCHLGVAGLVAAPYASALAVTDEDERNLGITVVDMGSGTTTAAVFGEGHFVHCAVIPSGGHHLTFEIAQNLHAPLAEAERIKSLYASMVNAPSDVGDRFSYSAAGEMDGGVQQATRAQLAGIVRPRMEQLMRQLAARLGEAGFGTGPVVLTGGASQLVGMAEFASHCLDREVWCGRPRAALAIPPAAGSPAGAASAGLVLAARGGRQDGLTPRGGEGYLSRVGRWFESSF